MYGTGVRTRSAQKGYIYNQQKHQTANEKIINREKKPTKQENRSRSIRPKEISIGR